MLARSSSPVGRRRLVVVVEEPGDDHSGVLYAPGDGWSGWGVVMFSLLLVGQTGTS